MLGKSDNIILLCRLTFCHLCRGKNCFLRSQKFHKSGVNTFKRQDGWSVLVLKHILLLLTGSSSRVSSTWPTNFSSFDRLASCGCEGQVLCLRGGLHHRCDDVDWSSLRHMQQRRGLYYRSECQTVVIRCLPYFALRGFALRKFYAQWVSLVYGG